MGLKVFDATCPLVTKVHIEVAKMRAAGREIIMIGHRGHPEVEGTLGQAQDGMYLVETPEDVAALRSEEHTSELQSLMRISYAVFCLTKKKTKHLIHTKSHQRLDIH